YGRGNPEDAKGAVENEDFASVLCSFENGATGSFEVSRTLVGPESQNAFEIFGTKGSISWNFEKLNELEYYQLTDSKNSGYTTIYGGDR
ncbi:Gfo/Idh/MocA family oxidoreductase, partial [Acinetobacter baumannii]